jgi:hypothetical protein
LGDENEEEEEEEESAVVFEGGLESQCAIKMDKPQFPMHQS